jgi:hypothetical protein
VSKTDKDKPGRVKLAEGQKMPRRYHERVAFYSGRDYDWRDAVKARSGQDRMALRAALRDARYSDPDDVDILPAVTGGKAGTSWIVY